MRRRCCTTRPEYVIGDLISPFKAAIGLDYKAFEQRLLAAIYRRFEHRRNRRCTSYLR